MLLIVGCLIYVYLVLRYVVIWYCVAFCVGINVAWVGILGLFVAVSDCLLLTLDSAGLNCCFELPCGCVV